MFNILIADDSLDNQFLIEAFLKTSGHLMTFVSDGRQAVEAVQQWPFDLLLMDVQMPVMDGLAATKAIRDWESSQQMRTAIPIVAVTANAEQRDLEEAAGCTGHLSKPLSREKLVRVIEQHARARETHRQTA